MGIKKLFREPSRETTSPLWGCQTTENLFVRFHLNARGGSRIVGSRKENNCRLGKVYMGRVRKKSSHRTSGAQHLHDAKGNALRSLEREKEKEGGGKTEAAKDQEVGRSRQGIRGGTPRLGRGAYKKRKKGDTKTRERRKGRDRQPGRMISAP